MKRPLKELHWLGNSLKVLRELPEDVQDGFGYALHIAQTGDRHRSAKPLKGFSGAGVLEIVEDDDGNTYRAIYTVKFSEAIYVLHVFQKKSKKGIETPRQEIELIESRLKLAQEIHKELG